MTSPVASVSDDLLGALFTSTQQKILRIFFSEIEQRLSLQDVIRAAEAGSGAVQREVEKFTKAGLLSFDQIGRQKLYYANPVSPIYAEIRAIIAKTAGVTERVKKVIQRLDTDIETAFIFGSVAKGTDHAQSDLDILIVANELDLSTLYDAFSPLEKEIGRKINPTLYTEKEWQSKVRAKNSFVVKVMDGPRIPLVDSTREKVGLKRKPEIRKSRKNRTA